MQDESEWINQEWGNRYHCEAIVIPSSGEIGLLYSVIGPVPGAGQIETV